jgi:hypothetical protein
MDLKLQASGRQFGMRPCELETDEQFHKLEDGIM